MSESLYDHADFPHGLMFHHFVGGKHPAGQGAIDAETFDACLNYAGRGRILSADEWIWKVKRQRLDQRDLCVTFDDGLACQFDIALPVLRGRSILAFWFVYSAPLHGEPSMLEVWRLFRNSYFDSVDNFYARFHETLSNLGWRAETDAALASYDPAPLLAAHPYYSVADLRFRFVRDEVLTFSQYETVMTWMMKDRGADPAELAKGLWMSAENIAALASDGHEIGLHSHTHPTTLAKLSHDEQRGEYGRNYDTLAGITGRSPVSVAHPCDSCNEDTLEILKSMGMIAGFRAHMQSPHSGPLEAPRQDHANLTRMMGAMA